MADPVRVWNSVLKKLFRTQAERVTLAIGHTIVDREDAMGRVYILVGPPATGKSTILDLISDMFEDDRHVAIIQDIDPDKIEPRPDMTIFCASNKEPREEHPNYYVINTLKKSRPMGMEEYKKVTKIMKDGVMDIRKHCAYRYVLTDTAYQRMKGENA